MLDQDKSKFIEVLNALSEMYRQPKPSVNLIKMYFGALSRWGIDDVLAGINQHTQNTDSGQFFPKPADIIRSIEGNTGTRGEQAWTKVDTAIKSVGPHQSVVFDDGLIHATIDDMGGWVTLCNSDGKEYPFKHNEFVKRYQGFINKPPLSYPRKLIGIAEGHNSSEGYKTPSPLLIGDSAKAALIYEKGSDSKRIGLTVMSETMKNMNKLLGN